MKIVGTLFGIYIVLFVALSHSSIILCRFGQNHLQVNNFSWKYIDGKLLDKCPQVSPIDSNS